MSIQLISSERELHAHVEANYNFRAPIYLKYSHFTKEERGIVLAKAARDALLDIQNDSNMQVTKRVAAYILQNKLGVQHELTDAELKQFYQASLDYIRPFYPELFSQINLDSSEAALASFLTSLISSIAQKCLTVFLETFEHKRFSLPHPLTDFFDSLISTINAPSSLSFSDRIAQIAPFLPSYQQFILAQFNRATGHTASSLEEMYDIQLQKSIEDFLLPYLADPALFNSEDFLSSLCRQSFSHLFYKGILKDIKTSKHSSRSLEILNLLIQDYISSSNGHLWRHSAVLNYGYALKTINDAVDQNPPETSDKMIHRFQAASQALNIFEFLLDAFVQNFERIKSMKQYLPALLFADITSLLEPIKQRQSQIKIDSSILSIQAGFLKAVIEEADPQLDPFQRELDFFRIRLQCLTHLGTLPDITLDSQQQETLDAATKIFDASLEACYQKLLEVQKMREKGYASKDNCSLLGIGFTGRDFEEEGNGNNTVFLNFSLTMRSRQGKISGSALLYAIKCFSLLHPTAKTPNFTIEIIEKPEQDDIEIFTYIVHHIIKTITSHPSQEIHKDVLESFANTFKDLLERQKTKLSRELQEVEKKLTKLLDQCQQMEEYHLIACMMIPDYTMLTVDQQHTTKSTLKYSAEKMVELSAEKENLTKQQKEKGLELTRCEEMLGRLQKNDYALDPDYLIKLIDEKKERICIEPVISRVTGNPYTLSFAMSESIGDPIFLNQENFHLGDKRLLIQPCNIKCQLFSPAHMLWAELTHFPTAQQAHERSEKKGGPGLASIFS